MEIKPDFSAGALEKVAIRARPARESRPAGDDLAFGAAHALDEQLAHAPDVRADVVARGQQLAQQPDYPPPEIIKRIARLLAVDPPHDSP